MGTDTQPGEPRWGLTDAAAGVLGAIVLALALGGAFARFWIVDAQIAMLLGYLVVWVPLLGAVLIACFWRGSRSLVRDFGLRFRPLDLLWGLSIGLLARVVASFVEIGLFGHIGGGSVTFGETVYDGWWLFGTLLAPVLIAPFIEELFFRGLLLRAVARATAAGGGTVGVPRSVPQGVPRSVPQSVSLGIAIAVSGLVFALVHVLQASSVSGAWAVGLSTLVFGLAAAALAALTGRLGGAIIAHVTFNALVVVPALLL
jgi:membrane protease YdiL (CAAX protease family)